MRSRNSLPLLFLSFTLSSFRPSFRFYLFVAHRYWWKKCEEVIRYLVYDLVRCNFRYPVLEIVEKKIWVVRDSVIQDNFAFHTGQRFNLPRDSIHSTDCTLLYANGVSQFLASRSLSLSSRRLSLARSTRAILRLVPPLPSAAHGQREVFAGQFAPGRLPLHRRKPSRVQGKLNDRDSPWSFDSLI